MAMSVKECGTVKLDNVQGFDMSETELQDMRKEQAEKDRKRAAMREALMKHCKRTA